MEIGKMKLSSLLPMLNEIAVQHELKLNRAREFKLAVRILRIRMFTNC
jgi:hypothetical protein